MEQPTDQKIAEVIALFEERAPKIPQHNAFGQSNREQIDAQIRVLRKYNDFLDLDELLEEFEIDSEEDYDLFSVVRDAWEWCDGELDEADGKFEDRWADMVGRPEPEQLRREDYE